MSRKVMRVNGNTYISISKNCFAKLVLNGKAMPYLYASPKSVNIPLYSFYYLVEDEYENFETIDDVIGFLTGYENQCLYYTGWGVDYWVNTGRDTFDEYVEICRDYPISKQQYTTLVKRYCVWAK